MSYIRGARQTARVAIAIFSTLIGIVLFAPSTFAVIAPLGGAATGVSLQPQSKVLHAVVAGGMAGWQISLIAVGAALLSAPVAIFIDHARFARRSVRISAA